MSCSSLLPKNRASESGDSLLNSPLLLDDLSDNLFLMTISIYPYHKYGLGAGNRHTYIAIGSRLPMLSSTSPPMLRLQSARWFIVGSQSVSRLKTCHLLSALW